LPEELKQYFIPFASYLPKGALCSMAAYKDIFAQILTPNFPSPAGHHVDDEAVTVKGSAAANELQAT